MSLTGSWQVSVPGCTMVHHEPKAMSFPWITRVRCLKWGYHSVLLLRPLHAFWPLHACNNDMQARRKFFDVQTCLAHGSSEPPSKTDFILRHFKPAWLHSEALNFGSETCRSSLFYVHSICQSVSNRQSCTGWAGWADLQRQILLPCTGSSASLWPCWNLLGH